jgi:hypothetical protein
VVWRAGISSNIRQNWGKPLPAQQTPAIRLG